MDEKNKPVVVDKAPVIIELEAKNHAWCSCGRSQKQPFCDGAHKETDFTPVVFTLEEGKRVALCNCKHTKNPPYCDGSHSSL